ncbi:MAG: YggS family pyridoxal phosphate-dependent enzyme [Gallionella sp.]
MTTIASNLQAVNQQIHHAVTQAKRSIASLELLAVSKTFSADEVRAAYHAGQTAFAENYVQEAVDKIAALRDLPLTWHFIGPIQSNKTRLIAENFSWVHSVDRLKIAERLSAQRPLNLPPLQICLQVNISDETSKSGVSAAEALPLAQQLARLPHLKLRGLMAVPAASCDVVVQRAAFAKLRALRDALNQHDLQLDTLSMGMSHDFPAAIAEGATLLRIGSAIFGNRIYSKDAI